MKFHPGDKIQSKTFYKILNRGRVISSEEGYYHVLWIGADGTPAKKPTRVTDLSLEEEYEMENAK